MTRWFFVFLLLCSLIFCFPSQGSFAQENGEDAETIELQQPNYTNSDYGFGMVFPADYTEATTEEGEAWVLEIIPHFPDLASARLSVEELGDNITDVSGFWQALKDRDPAMTNNITYEKTTSVAETGAMQARIEALDAGQYILTIVWVWVHDGHGFTLSGYPPAEGSYNAARDFSKQLVDQFRWMTTEEITATEAAGPPPTTETSLGEGREF